MNAKPPVEHRKALRIRVPCPVRVRGVDASGKRFEEDASLENLSAGGFYLKLARRVEQRAKLFIVVWLSGGPSDTSKAGRIAMRGVVLRTEPQPDGKWGVAARITSYRFL